MIKIETNISNRLKLHEEQEKLSIVCPFYRHSIGEDSTLFNLHVQLVDDSRTVILIAESFFNIC